MNVTTAVFIYFCLFFFFIFTIAVGTEFICYWL